MSDIRLLSPVLINKIAAGEVVERPASIVKELLENSLDAGAKNITVRIEQGGINFIEVEDDGIGMNEQNAKLAFAQHATSKIKDEKDLESIFTLGFRGEALASISSIATTTLHTKTSKTDPVFVSIQNGQVTSKDGEGRNTGTTVTVKNVFQKIPARKKFLKSENVEYKHTLGVFTKCALANFDVGFTLYHNNKEIFSLKPVKNQEERLIQVYPNLKNNLVPVTFLDMSIEISGYIGHPSINRKDKSIQYIFVNKRAVNEPVVASAIKTGFGSNLMHNQQPVYFLNINIDPKRVDVNVHPRKNEIRFDNQQEIFRIVYNSVRKSLENHLQSELKERFRNFSADQPSATTYNSSRPTGSFPKPSSTNVLDYSTEKPQPVPDSIQKSLEFTKTLLTDTQGEDRAYEEEKTIKALQIFDTYVVMERGEDMYVIDQHAAAERITFERIKSRFEKHESLPSQSLLIPEEITLSEGENIDLLENKQTLHHLGFEFELKGTKVLLKAVPEISVSKSPKKFFSEIVSNINEFNRNTKKEDLELLNKIIATVACHSSIRAGQRLEEIQVNQLIKDLLNCNQPYSCPHGRPIIWIVSQNELEKNFKRKL